jgi:hypothetical protein
MSTEVGSPNLEGKTRKISQSSRFEVHSVDENEAKLNSSIGPKTVG